VGIFSKNKNEGAYRGNLNCPVCQSTSIRYLEHLGPYRIRYRCRKCGLPFQYEIGSNPDAHPYEPFGSKLKFRNIIDISKGSTK